MNEWISIKIKMPDKPGMYHIFRIPKQKPDGRWLQSVVPIDERHWDGKKWDSTQFVAYWAEITNTMPEVTSEMICLLSKAGTEEVQHEFREFYGEYS